MYKLDKDHHDKLLRESITSTYKKADEKVYDTINEEAKVICLAKQQAFITLKDHEENFKNKPTCRLINPAKSEMRQVSKKILEKINTNIRNLTS